MSSDTETGTPPAPEKIDRVVIRFAGDSGDGMQLAGTQFTASSAMFGNDLATLPNYPSEIRAPAGTIAGVSSFQVHIADWDILTPGDHPDCLIVMNPAALKANLDDAKPGALIIVNRDAFNERNLAKAGYEKNPLKDGSLRGYHVLTAPMEELTKQALVGTGVKGRAVLRSKNFFALGLMSWMYTRPLAPVQEWIEEKFGDSPVAAANSAALHAGWNYGNTVEEFHHTFEVRAASLPKGEYTNVTGNVALAWGLIAGAQAANLPLFLGSYPITPATSILEELAKQKHFGVKTFQAEDEIAGVGTAVGAAFAGNLAVTTTSGPGLALKSETISLAFMMELPLIVIDVQRAGPSTGMPTRVEQSDLLFAMYGRHGEAPLPVLSVATPADAFSTAIEAARIATKYMTPVIVLSDGYIANSSEPWLIPDVESLPEFPVTLTTEPNDGDRFLPYVRDPETLARPWAVPGTPGLEHRLGGLEKLDGSGAVSYEGKNHQLMTEIRAAKIDAIQKDIPPITVHGDKDSKILVLGWGSTFSAIRAGVLNARKSGRSVAHAQIRHLNPLPPDLGEVLEGREVILIPELNNGQFSMMIRAKYLIETVSLTKIQGDPFKSGEIEEALNEICREINS
ncbi:MAG: 2-oxoacid:acceptor oxidoreductase subunit alpha [Actinomycetota bacterium]